MPSSGLTFIPFHDPVKADNFEDFLQKLHPETISAAFATFWVKVVLYKPGE